MSAFDRSDRFQHELPDILTAIASPRVPDYVDDLLAQAAATRQRARWTFLERWPGMDAIAYRVAAPAFPWRPVIIAALVLALGAAALLIAGAQQRNPPPFGLAANGAILFSDGDIYVRESIDGPMSLLIGGPEHDFAASFTRDGQRLTFLRRTSGLEGLSSERLQMFIADRDGSNAVPVTEPMISPGWMDVAPDNLSAVITAGDPLLGQHLFLADFREPGLLQPIDFGGQIDTATIPSFLGPTGEEIVFRGSTVTRAGIKFGIFAARPDGSGLRELTPTDGTFDAQSYSFPQVSPDGRFLAYTGRDSYVGDLRVHVVDLQSGRDRTLTEAGREEGWATFSPDSSRILFYEFLGGWDQLVSLPVDGNGPRLRIGPSTPPAEDASVGGLFSPDGKWVIVTIGPSGETRIVDAATGGDGELLPWSSADLSAWQRLAP